MDQVAERDAAHALELSELRAALEAKHARALEAASSGHQQALDSAMRAAQVTRAP